jgi:hypothetical protein
MLDKALCDDLRHGFGCLIPCQLPAARKAKRERGYDFARISGRELLVGAWHPPTIAEARERSKNIGSKKAPREWLGSTRGRHWRAWAGAN